MALQLCVPTEPTFILQISNNIRTVPILPLGTVCPVYRTGISRLSRERFFIYLINKYISLSDICLTVHH